MVAILHCRIGSAVAKAINKKLPGQHKVQSRMGLHPAVMYKRQTKAVDSLSLPAQCSDSTVEALQRLRSDLMAVVYSQTTMQLLIYQRGQRLNASIASYADLRVKPESRKASTTEGDMLDGVGAQRNMPSAEVLNDIKLDRELDTLMRIYMVAMEELTKQKTCEEAEVGAYATLRAAIEALKEDDTEEKRLQQQLRTHQAALRALRLRLEAERQEGEQRMAVQEERIETLRHNLRNARKLNELEVTLVQKWEENRYTQAHIVGVNAERRLQRQIGELKRRIGNEQRLICEVESFNGKQFEQLRERFSSWQRKYAEELARKNAQTEQLEQRSAALLKQHERHRQTYEQHLEFVWDYLELKAEEQRLLEQQIHRVECAVRIQAWWRGVMVRRGLGPYRKKTKKGKKAKAQAK